MLIMKYLDYGPLWLSPTPTLHVAMKTHWGNNDVGISPEQVTEPMMVDFDISLGFFWGAGEGVMGGGRS